MGAGDIRRICMMVPKLFPCSQSRQMKLYVMFR